MSNSVQSTDKQRIQQLMQQFDLGPTDSVGLLFAKLQLSQAQICKEKAKTLMNEITSIQAKQKETAQMIAKAREMQQKCKASAFDGQKGRTGKGMGKGNAPIPKELSDFMDKNNIHYPNDDKDWILGNEEWDYTIQSLTNYQETIANGTQTLLMQVQDFIGQYNSYESGASSAIDKANQITQTIVQK